MLIMPAIKALTINKSADSVPPNQEGQTMRDIKVGDVVHVRAEVAQVSGSGPRQSTNGWRRFYAA